MKRLLGLSILFGTLAAPSALATEVTPLRHKEGHRGQVSNAFVAPLGSYQLGLNSDYAGSVYVDPDGNRDLAIKEAVTSNISLIYGLTSRFQLGLSLNTSDEIAAPATYDYVHRHVAGTRPASMPRSAFNGVSLLGKYQFLSNGLFHMAFAAAIDSGMLDKDSYGLTRSDDPTGSWNLIATYGAPKSHQVSLNTGYRYRFPENVGPYLMRNEWFYRGGASAQVMDSIALFTSAEGRRVMRAPENGPFQKGSRRYRPEYSVGYHAGVALTLGESEIGLYAGRASETSHFGHGMRTYGMSLTMTLGGGSDEPAPRLDPDRKPTEFDELDAYKQKRSKAKGPLGEDRDVDFIRDMEDATERRVDAEKNPSDLDDFELLERREKEEREKPVRSSAEMAEEEIERIRAAKKAREEREAQRQAAEERARAKSDYEDLKTREKEMKKVEKDIKEQVDEYPTVTDDELNWKGLE